LVFVFFCNRVTPSRENPAFTESRVRYTLQQAVYDALDRFEAGERPDRSGAVANLLSGE
jgi:hypothetical protein